MISPYSKSTNNFIRFWGKSILFISGIKIEVVGREKISEEIPSVYMGNHQSLFDILGTVVAIPGAARFIAKKELFRIPLFAQGMKFVGMIKIDRGNSAQARQTINNAVKVIKNGVSVIIFPEGTRSRDGSIKQFKKGGFILATTGKIPIVPLVISGSHRIMKKRSLHLRKGKFKIEFLDPIQTEDKRFDDRNKLVNEVRQKIIEHYDPNYNKA